MRYFKMLLFAGVCLTAVSVLAQPGGGACPEYLGGGPVDPTPLFNALDLDNDGRVTHDEWVETEAPTSSWSAFMSKALVQKQGYITLFDFLTDDAPGTIDTNCDGEVSLAEFLATKSMAPPGGGDGAGVGGPGGAPDGAMGGPGGEMGGPGGGAQTTASHPSPTEPRDGLAEGAYDKASPGQYPPYPDGGAADPTPLYDALNANHDDRVTREEWQKAGAPDDLWQALAAKPRVQAHGYVTLYDLVMNPEEVQIEGIDTNEDGYITLEELLAAAEWTAGGTPAGPGAMGAPPQGGPPGGAPGGAAQSGGVYLKSDKMIAELDTNRDGCICKAEWTGAGLPEAIFGTLEGQAEKRDCVTDAELTKGAAPAGIDTDNDGYMSVQELKTYVAAHGTEPR